MAAVCQFTEPWLAKEIAGVTDWKNKEHVFNGGIFFLSLKSSWHGWNGIKCAAAEEKGQKTHRMPVAGGTRTALHFLKNVISAIILGSSVIVYLQPQYALASSPNFLWHPVYTS